MPRCTELRTIIGHKGQIYAVAFNESGAGWRRRVTTVREKYGDISLGASGNSAGDRVGRARHQGWVNGVAFSRIGTRLATSTRTRPRQRMFPQAHRQQGVTDALRPYRSGHGVAFSRDGTQLVTATVIGLRKHGMRVRGNFVDLVGHADEVRYATFSPDGNRMATGQLGWHRTPVVRTDREP